MLTFLTQISQSIFKLLFANNTRSTKGVAHSSQIDNRNNNWVDKDTLIVRDIALEFQKNINNSI
jgi:hypothetical protein